MRERLQHRLTEIQKERKESRRRLRLRSVLALSVSFVVLYGLLLPAFTLEKPVFCGYEAHVHTDDCYEYYLTCPVTGEKQGPLTVEELQQLIASGIRLSDIPVAGADSTSEDELYRPVQGSHVHTGQGGSSDDQGYATSGGNHSGTGDLVVSEAEHPEKSQMPAAADGEGVTATPSDYDPYDNEDDSAYTSSGTEVTSYAVAGSGGSADMAVNTEGQSVVLLDDYAYAASDEGYSDGQEVGPGGIGDTEYADTPEGEGLQEAADSGDDSTYAVVSNGEFAKVEAEELGESTDSIDYTAGTVNSDVTENAISGTESINSSGLVEEASANAEGEEVTVGAEGAEGAVGTAETEDTEGLEGVDGPAGTEDPASPESIESPGGTDAAANAADGASPESAVISDPELAPIPSAEDLLPVEGTHVHTAACYVKVAVCGYEEHEHSLACFADPEADVEDLGLIEDLFPTFEEEKVRDSYEYAAKLAEFQTGYLESKDNYMIYVDEDGAETQQGYTRYGDWAGDPYAQEWNALFAAFTAEYAGLDNEIYNSLAQNPAGHDAEEKDYLVSAGDWMQALRDASLEEPEIPEYLGDSYIGTDVIPQIRDMAFAYLDAGNFDALESVPSDPALKSMLIRAMSAGHRYGENSFRDVEGYIDLNFADYLLENDEQSGSIEGSKNTYSSEYLSLQYYADGHPAAPAVGELVFLDLDGDSYTDHVGIITAVNFRKDRMTVVLGDMDGRVKEEKFEFDQMEVLGYASLPETEEAVRRNIEVLSLYDPAALPGFGEIELESEADAEGETEETGESEVAIEEIYGPYFSGYLSYGKEEAEAAGFDPDTIDYEITLSIGEDACIPEDAVLSVEEITEGSPEYDFYVSRSLEAIGNVTDAFSIARFFDITFTLAGEEIEPKAPIGVMISYDESYEVPDGIRKAIHFIDEENIEVIGVDEGDDTASNDAADNAGEEILSSDPEETGNEESSAESANFVAASESEAVTENTETAPAEAGLKAVQSSSAGNGTAPDFNQDEAFAAAQSHDGDTGLIGGIKKLGRGLRNLLIKDTMDLESEMGFVDENNVAVTDNAASVGVSEAEPFDDDSAGVSGTEKLVDIKNSTDPTEDAPEGDIDSVTGIEPGRPGDADEIADIKTSANVENESAVGRKAEKAEKAAKAPKAKSSGRQTFSFVQGSFSVTGTVVYTVDIHYTVDGREYEISIPGGGFLSLSRMFEALGLAYPETGESGSQSAAEASFTDETDELSETGTVSTSSTDVPTESVVSYSSDTEELPEAETAYSSETEEISGGSTPTAKMPESNSINSIEVTDATKRFVEDIAEIRFSSPELVWVGKIEDDTTVGELKAANELDVQYSAELTEEEIDTINAQTVESGDWALISVYPFETEEKLTVTMKNGEQFEIKVTDAQDPLGLNGRTFAIVTKKYGTTGHALQAGVHTTRDNRGYYLEALNVNLNDSSQYTTIDSIEYVRQDATAWTFEYNALEQAYYISHNGEYLCIDPSIQTKEGTPDHALNLVSDKSASGTLIRITRDEDGNYNFGNEHGTLLWDYGNGYWLSHPTRDEEGVVTDAKIRLCMPENPYGSHKASLISAADLSNGQSVIIYQKVWNGDTDAYDFYAIDGHGNLQKVWESSDSLYWKEDISIEWKLIELTNAAGNPTGYLQLYNPVTDTYLSPKSNGDGYAVTHAASGLTPETMNTISVSLPGRDAGTYGSRIATWDYDDNTTYGIKLNYNPTDTPPCTLEVKELLQSTEFLFAVRDPLVQKQLTEVDTVDSVAKGITIKMYDFDDENHGWGQRLPYIQRIIRSNPDYYYRGDWASGEYTPGLMRRVLVDGWPVATETGKSLSAVFVNLESDRDYGFTSVTKSENANHLFLQSVYDTTGYFYYSGFENFARLNGDDFIVYEQLGTPKDLGEIADSGPTDHQNGNFFYYRGNFMPLNELDTNNPVQNYYAGGAYRAQLSEDDPRKKEDLYVVKDDPNYFFGMTLESKFMQGIDGLSDQGDPMVFEFTGDDDMWVYVDDVLLLDIGGVHDAFHGKINFQTGKIHVDGQNTGDEDTYIREQFWQAKRFPDGSSWTDRNDPKQFEFFTDGGESGGKLAGTFTDLSTHDMKMFYMERGAGASNLQLRFNLPVLTESQFQIRKEMPETESGQLIQNGYADAAFYYEAYIGDGASYTKVTPQYLQDHGLSDPVYAETGEPVIWKSNSQDETIFEIKPGYTAIIPAIDDGVHWYAVEVEPEPGSHMLDDFTVSNSDPDPAVIDGTKSKEETIKKRNLVVYQNRPDDDLVNELRITKKINGTPYKADDAFEYRIFLESTDGVLKPYSLGEYYQTDALGRYIYYQKGERVIQSENPNGPYTYMVDGQMVTSDTPRYAEHTSTNGSLGDIRDGDTIIIKGLLEGTDFYVYERTDYDYMSKNEVPAAGKYVFEGTEVQDAYIRSSGQNAPEHPAGHLYDAPKGLDDLIVRYNISEYEQNHAASGAIIQEKDAKVLVKNRPYLQSSIAVQKNWPADSMEALTDDTAVTFTLSRYKLDQRHGTVKLTGTLVNAPDDADPVYLFMKEEQLVRAVNYSERDANGVITVNDLPIGTYTVSCYDHAPGYNMTYVSLPVSVEVTENEEPLLCTVTSTYTPFQGTLVIRKTLTGYYSLDSGTLSYTITGENYAHTTDAQIIKDISGGSYSVTISDLPIGTYRVTETVTGSSGTHTPQTGQTVLVRAGETVYADFAGMYEVRMIPLTIHTGYSPNNGGNGWTEVNDNQRSFQVPAGSRIQMDFNFRECSYWGGRYLYGESPDTLSEETALIVSGDDSGVIRTESLFINIPSDAESYDFYVKSMCDNAYWAPTVNGSPAVVADTGASMLSMTRRLTVKTPELRAGDTQAVTYENVAKVYNTPVILPDLSEEEAAKKAFVADSNWSMTVELKKTGYVAKIGDEVVATGDITTGTSFWNALINHSSILKEDENGNPYYYYISAVSEINVPAGMTPVFDMDGEKTLMTSKDAEKVLSVSNYKASLSVTKVIKGTATPLTGAKFTLTRVDENGRTITEGNEKYSSGEQPVDSTGKVTFSGLKIGWYKLEETTMPPGYVKREGPYYFYLDGDSAVLNESLTGAHNLLIQNENDPEVTVENEPGAELPSTGGPGTDLTRVLGLLLMLLALGLDWVILRKRHIC